MKQAGRVRGGVKPSGGCETLKADRSRAVEGPAHHRGFPVLGALEGRKAQEGTAQLEPPVRGRLVRWRPKVKLCRRRNFVSVTVVLRSVGARERKTSRHPGAGWTRHGWHVLTDVAHPGRARREGRTDRALRSRAHAEEERNFTRGRW
jgi:hypothetical protein